ncbi:ankyrin-3-like [Lolium rigidum]|uniref:ankyrin-3-like n=1 Tax=Lolium rigidum TaxID=89674 RepID=UPI001F5E2442|nr:ankyrin-3-like [Lolium rigidum]
MAPQPPLHPLNAFESSRGLPPGVGEPSRFSSNPTFDQAFLMAAFKGDLRRVKQAARALGRGAEGRRLAEKVGSVMDGSGMRLIHIAALGGSLPVCRYLLEDLGLDVDVDGPSGETAIEAAIARENVELVRLFLDQGADTEKLDKKGCTLLHFAAKVGNYEIVKLLLSKGARVNAINLGGTALHVAASDGRDDIVKILLDHGAYHNIALSGTDYTALVLATIERSMKCVKLLLEAGADVDGIGKETPLMIAATAGSTDILKCLLLAGADANVTDTYGRTPIEIVALSGRREDVEILFPFTSRLSNARDWSVDGVIGHVISAPPAKEAMLASAKSKAHKAFKNGNYLVATKIYDEAMVLDPGNASLLSNRSLCWLRFGDARKALSDAQLCRMMRPGWPKACYREGTALMLLKDYEKACGAFLEGVKLEPCNTEIEDGLREALESLKTSGSSTGKDLLDQHQLVGTVN